MDRPTCKTCPYHLRQEQNDDQGTCCRFPPRVPDDYSQQGDALSMLWPLTFHDATCGEHPDFPAFIASTRKPMSRIPDDLPIKAGDSLYWDEFAKRYVHHQETPPTAPPFSPPTPPCEPSERAPTTAQADRPPE